jgi:hypothetical protein
MDPAGSTTITAMTPAGPSPKNNAINDYKSTLFQQFQKHPISMIPMILV